MNLGGQNWVIEGGQNSVIVPTLNSKTATPPRIEEEIRYGHYHIFHFAGHGDYDNVKPIIEVFEDETMNQTEQISAISLKNWINDSDLRFVYINSCRSTSTEDPELGKVIQNFENISHAIVQAHVPEVIGFIWPIEDIESKILAQRFYKNFLKGFNASLSLFYARTSFEEENRIWAAPVLIQQTDTY
jgi:CHAT domain-containing protein